MATNIYLTDELSDIVGYYRAKLNNKSDIPSLIQSITNTVTNPASQPQITRKVTDSTPLAWITDPLANMSFTAAAWTINVWAMENNALANTGLKVVLLPYTNALGSALLTDSGVAELPTTIQNYNRTTGNATLTAITDGTRLVIQLWLVNQGGSAAGYTVQVSYNGLYAYSEGDSYLVCPDFVTDLAVLPQSTLTTIRQYLKDSEPSAPLLDDTFITQAFYSALDEYNLDRPRIESQFYTGDGVSFSFPLPRYWVWNFSRIVEIEYPTTPSAQVRNILDKRYYEIVQYSINTQPYWILNFSTFTPDTTVNNIILRYTAKHKHTTVNSTIPVQDVNALYQLATSHAALILKSSMAGTSDSTIQADVVNYRDGVSRWEAVSKSYRDRYNQHMGINQEVPAMQVSYNWDSYYSWNQDRLTHPRRYR